MMRLLAVGALKQISNDHGEVKAMHTIEISRRGGVGTAMLLDIVEADRVMGLSRVSLETGSWPYFLPAHALYSRHGFVECPPFGEYVSDPNSVFMTLDLRKETQGVRTYPGNISARGGPRGLRSVRTATITGQSNL